MKNFLILIRRRSRPLWMTRRSPMRMKCCPLRRRLSEKMTVLVVEPMKEPYVKEINPDLHSLQAEVGGDIGATYPYSDPVALVCNDEGKPHRA